MLVDLIKRIVITEKYLYRDDEQTQFDMRLQKFKDTQAQQKQEQEQEQEQEAKNNSENQSKKLASIETEANQKDANQTKNSLNDKTAKFKNSNDSVKKNVYPTYAFDLDVRLTKPQIKALLEKVFNVDIVSLNTYIAPMKKKRVGFNQGYKAKYKRAIIKLKPNQTLINPLDQ